MRPAGWSVDGAILRDLQIFEFLADGTEKTGKDIADAVGITLALLCHHTGALEDIVWLPKKNCGNPGHEVHRSPCR